MDPDRWRLVERIFHSVAAVPHEVRPDFLDRECAGDDGLKADVARMLAVESDGSGFLEVSAVEVAARALAASAPLRPGSSFGSYRILHLLGAGGMGEVYKAIDARLNRNVALKILPAAGAEGEDRRRLLLREARAASAVKHPHIVTIYDIFSESGRDALVMEYVEGRTLEALMAGKRLPLAETLHYAIQIAGALAAAHAAGLVHRDVKPGNIMITGGGSTPGNVTVLDFGVAKFLDPTGGPVETTGTHGGIVGTVAYMSPEQVEGRPVDARSDCFSFGVLLYRMLTGREAFLRDTTTTTLAAILRDEYESVSGIPESLRALLARCLRKDPARRAGCMEDIRAQLEEIREEIERPRRAGVATKRIVAAAAVVLLASAGWMAARRIAARPAAFAIKPLTSYPGRAASPSFSPDGNQVVFHWNGEKQDNWDIYVKLVDAAAPLRLTSNPAADTRPSWSPDGRWIAFLREGSPTTRELLLISPAGGAERKLAVLDQGINPANWWSAPTWTPDSRFLAVRDDTAIVLVSVESGEKRRLTQPPASWTGDRDAAFSPDGRTLAFVRIRNGPTQDVFLAPASQPANARPLTHDYAWIDGLAWTADGKEIVFSSKRAGDSSLWRIPVSGGVPEPLLSAAEHAILPAISGQGGRAAFVRAAIRKSFWRLDLGSTDLRCPPVRLVESSRSDSNPALSPDGRRIAFHSDRSGPTELWLCDSDGGNAVRLTSLGFARNASWSPDSRYLAFEARPEDHNQIFVVAAGGGTPRALTSYEGYYPSWSRDGRWVYFYSRRSGAIETWKVPSAGGEGIQLTKHGGGPGIESVDGRYFYYHRSQELWKIPVAGGEESLVTREPVNFMNLFAIGDKGLYYLKLRETEHQSILKLFDFRTGRSIPLAILDQPLPSPQSRLSLSPGGAWLLYGQTDRDESDIMLIENFR